MFLALLTKYSICTVQLALINILCDLVVGLEFGRGQRQVKLPSIQIILKMCVTWFYSLHVVTRDGSAVWVCLPEQETSLRLCSASSDRVRRECVFNDTICNVTEMTWQLKDCLLRGASSPASSFAVPPPALLFYGINWCWSCCKESRLKLLTQQEGLPPCVVFHCFHSTDWLSHGQRVLE